MLYSVGDSAKHAFASNPKNTIFDAKRLIGRRMDDPDVTQDLKHLWVISLGFTLALTYSLISPFEVVSKEGKPIFRVEHQGSLKEFVSAHAPVNVLSDGTFRPPRKSAQWYSRNLKRRPKHT